METQASSVISNEYFENEIINKVVIACYLKKVTLKKSCEKASVEKCSEAGLNSNNRNYILFLLLWTSIHEHKRLIM